MNKFNENYEKLMDQYSLNESIGSLIKATGNLARQAAKGTWSGLEELGRGVTSSVGTAVQNAHDEAMKSIGVKGSFFKSGSKNLLDAVASKMGAGNHIKLLNDKITIKSDGTPFKLYLKNITDGTKAGFVFKNFISDNDVYGSLFTTVNLDKDTMKVKKDKLIDDTKFTNTYSIPNDVQKEIKESLKKVIEEENSNKTKKGDE